MAAKIGDTVRFLNDVGGGIVVKIKDNLAYVADEDGFETPMPLRECVVVATAKEDKPKTVEAIVKPTNVTPQPPSKSTDKPADEDEPIIETPEGDVLNVVLAFEPHNLKRLSESGFDAVLVNDSNYYLYFTFMTRGDGCEKWKTHYAGVVEPNFQLLLAELSVSDLPAIDRVALQFVAFKRDKDFELKPPVAYESRLDTSKFARLHCFHPNIYFDEPVIALDVVKDDEPQKGAITIVKEEEEVVIPREQKPAARPVKRRDISKKAQKNTDPLVVDLHISELLDDWNGMSNAEILNYQIDKFREVMDANMNFGGKKIVFIHGKGEGILRQALLKELNYRYKACSVQDASFREYGYGATQVTVFRDHNKR